MPVKIITKRGNELGSLPNFSKTVKLLYIGESFGKTSIVYANENTSPFTGAYADSVTFAFDSEFISIGASDILNIYTTLNDQFNVYIKDIDFEVTVGVEGVEDVVFLDNPIKPPELEVSLGTSGSGLNGRNYNYKIVAYGYDGTTTTSLPSTAITVLSSSDTSVSHKLNWTKVPHAQGYIIYDSTANTRIAIIANQNTTTYHRTTNAGTAVTIPTSATAFRKPASDVSELYVDYSLITYNTDIKNFTSLNQVEKAHGQGSSLTNMARIAFQEFNIPELYALDVGARPSIPATNQMFLDAIDKVKNLDDVQYISALRDSDTVVDFLINHARFQSSDDEQKERFAVVPISSSYTEVGDESTSGTIRYRLASGNNEKRAYFTVINGNKVYMNQYQETDGTFTENKLVPNYYLSGAIAALIVTADDVATSIIGREVSGFNFGDSGAPWIDSVEQNKIEASGGTYVKSKNGKLVVYNDNTNDTSSTENSERVVLSAEDELRRRLRKANEQYLGRKIVQGLISAIYSTTNSIVKQMVNDLLINSYNEASLEVNQDETIKTKVNVVFKYEPIYPLKELTFSYSFDL